MLKSHVAGGVSEQGDMPKGSFQRMVLESSTGFSMAGFVSFTHISDDLYDSYARLSSFFYKDYKSL